MTIQNNRILALALALSVLGAGTVSADKPNKQDKKDKNAAKHEQQQARQNERAKMQAERQAHRSRQQMVGVQRARHTAYDRRLAQQTVAMQRRNEALRASKRQAQYEYQQQYLAYLNQQKTAKRNYNYDNDPYYSTAPAYRYQRAGRTYQVNQYAADVLRLAVNNGYEQGVRAGQADQQDRWSNTRFQDSYAFQDATYGYEGQYVDMPEYQHYFREGFQRGYQDGVNSRFQYGTNNGGQYSLLANVLTAILNLQSMR
jgi:hypothetical protein